MDLLCLLLNANSAVKIHNTTTLPTDSCLFIPCCPFNFTWSSQGSLILVLFSFYQDVTNITKGVGLKILLHSSPYPPLKECSPRRYKIDLTHEHFTRVIRTIENVPLVVLSILLSFDVLIAIL